jgi:hypothetical protein
MADMSIASSGAASQTSKSKIPQIHYFSDANVPRGFKASIPCKTYPCNRCGKEFSRKAILQDHLNVHDNKKPFFCDYPLCTMSFARKSDMRRHHSSHLVIRKKLCEKCGKGYSRTDVLLDHWRLVYGREMPRMSARNSQFHQQAGGSSYSLPPLFMDDDDFPWVDISGPLPFFESGSLGDEKPAPSLAAQLDAPQSSLRTVGQLLQPIFPQSLKLQCRICERRHSDTIELKEHLEQHRKDTLGPCRYACLECETVFSHHFELLNHRQTIQRLPLGSRECNSCEETLENLEIETHQDLLFI